MRARVLSIAVVMALAVPCTAAIRQSADAPFDGRWTFVSAKPVRPAFDQFWLGTEAVIRQTPTSIEITRSAPAPERRAAFVLGKETQHVFTIGGQQVIHDSRATIRDGVLIISTETTRGEEMRRLSHIMRLTVGSDGVLTVTDTQICGHGECPSIVTTLQFERQRGEAGLQAFTPAVRASVLPLSDRVQRLVRADENLTVRHGR